MRGLGGQARGELLVTTGSCACVPSAAPSARAPAKRKTGTLPTRNSE